VLLLLVLVLPPPPPLLQLLLLGVRLWVSMLPVSVCVLRKGAG
jgi:hypothetical protein